MNKKNQLISILRQHFKYPDNEINHIVKHTQPEWFTFDQTDKEVIQQIHNEYALWRGLGTAISDYLQWEKDH